MPRLCVDFRLLRWPVWLAAGFAVAYPLAASAQTEPPLPRIKTSVHLVEVDVIARDKQGNPVADLLAKDFVLLDDGKEQKITRVSLQSGAAQPGDAKPIADSKVQVNSGTYSNTHPESLAATVILLDLLNTAEEDQPGMKKALLRALSQMKEGTPVALLLLGDELTVVSDFTTSKISLGNAAGGQMDLRPEGFGPPVTARSTGNPVMDRIIMRATTQAFQAEDRDRTAHTVAALNIIARQMARMRGRKSLLWVSGGLDSGSEHWAMEDAIDRLNDANVAVYTVDARGVLLDPDLSAANDPNDLAGPLNENREEVRNDVLAVMATSTGGVFYHNTNDLEGAVARAMDDRRVVYVLEYYPRHGDWHGKLHKLEVKSSRPGVRLRYRASYRATLPAEPSAQDQQQQLAAVASSPLDFSGIQFSVEVKPRSAADPGLVLHVPVEEVQWSAEDGKMLAAMQVWLIQKRASGADLLTSSWKSNFRIPANAYPEAARTGLAMTTDVKLQANATKVRVLIRDLNSGKIGTVDVPVEKTPEAGH